VWENIIFSFFAPWVGIGKLRWIDTFFGFIGLIGFIGFLVLLVILVLLDKVVYGFKPP
jgi:hypothetical protein